MIQNPQSSADGTWTETPPADLVIGTRGSALALWQANSVRTRLLDLNPDSRVELAIISSEGDRDKLSPLTQIGGRGVFASALQDALLRGEIDIAVHSTKDVPGLTPTGLVLAAFPERDIPFDALVSRHGVGLSDLPPSPLVGTSSRRRAVQVLALRPDARIVDLRGNIDTRLRKSRTEAYDAIILAAAGLSRMGWVDEITELLPLEAFTPAPGQGVLGVETRLAPDRGWNAATLLDDPDVRRAVTVERAFLQGLGGGCTTPIGAYARLVDSGDAARIELHAMVATEDGSRLERTVSTFPFAEAEDGAVALAKRMLRSVQPAWSGVDFASVDEPEPSLPGVRVLLTGSSLVADAQAAQVASEGGVPILFPTVRIEPPTSTVELDDAVNRALDGEFDWIVFTSANAVPALAEHVDGQTGLTARVAAVGERTADALSNAGIPVDLVPKVGNGAGLLEAMAASELSGVRILLLLSNIASPDLAAGLGERGALVETVIAYRTSPIESVDPALLTQLQSQPPHAVFLSSPSAVAGLTGLLGSDLSILGPAYLVAIGETTATALREAGLSVHAIATTPTPIGMVQALRDLCEGHHGQVSTESSNVERTHS